MSSLTVPSIAAPLVDAAGRITNVWRSYLQALNTQANAASGTAQPPVIVPVSGNPIVFTAPADGFLIVSGSGVAGLAINRGGVGYISTGAHYGSFPMKQGDLMKVTYPGIAPVLTYFSG